MQLHEAITQWLARHQALLSESSRRDINDIAHAARAAGFSALQCERVREPERLEIIALAQRSSTLNAEAVGQFLAIVVEWGIEHEANTAATGAFASAMTERLPSDTDDWNIDAPGLESGDLTPLTGGWLDEPEAPAAHESSDESGGGRTSAFSSMISETDSSEGPASTERDDVSADQPAPPAARDEVDNEEPHETPHPDDELDEGVAEEDPADATDEEQGEPGDGSDTADDHDREHHEDAVENGAADDDDDEDEADWDEDDSEDSDDDSDEYDSDDDESDDPDDSDDEDSDDDDEDDSDDDSDDDDSDWDDSDDDDSDDDGSDEDDSDWEEDESDHDSDPDDSDDDSDDDDESDWDEDEPDDDESDHDSDDDDDDDANWDDSAEDSDDDSDEDDSDDDSDDGDDSDEDDSNDDDWDEDHSDDDSDDGDDSNDDGDWDEDDSDWDEDDYDDEDDSDEDEDDWDHDTEVEDPDDDVDETPEIDAVVLGDDERAAGAIDPAASSFLRRIDEDRPSSRSVFGDLAATPADDDLPTEIDSGIFSAAAEDHQRSRAIDWITVAYFVVAAICFALVIYFYFTS